VGGGGLEGRKASGDQEESEEGGGVSGRGAWEGNYFLLGAVYLFRGWGGKKGGKSPARLTSGTLGQGDVEEEKGLGLGPRKKHKTLSPLKTRAREEGRRIFSSPQRGGGGGGGGRRGPLISISQHKEKIGTREGL